MRKKLLFIAAMLPLAVCAQNKPFNPLLVHSNEPIRFEKFTAATIEDAVNQVMAKCNNQIKAIIAVPAGKQTIANTLTAFDELSYNLSDLSGKVYIPSATFTDDKTRDEANKQIDRLSSYGSDLYLNVPLYKALKGFASSPVAKTLNAQQKKFLRETLVSFEINGTPNALH